MSSSWTQRGKVVACATEIIVGATNELSVCPHHQLNSYSAAAVGRDSFSPEDSAVCIYSKQIFFNEDDTHEAMDSSDYNVNTVSIN